MKAIGWLLISIPFIGITAVMVKEVGWKVALGLWAAVGIVTGLVILGTILVFGWS